MTYPSLNKIRPLKMYIDVSHCYDPWVGLGLYALTLSFCVCVCVYEWVCECVSAWLNTVATLKVTEADWRRKIWAGHCSSPPLPTPCLVVFGGLGWTHSRRGRLPFQLHIVWFSGVPLGSGVEEGPVFFMFVPGSLDRAVTHTNALLTLWVWITASSWSFPTHICTNMSALSVVGVKTLSDLNKKWLYH